MKKNFAILFIFSLLTAATIQSKSQTMSEAPQIKPVTSYYSSATVKADFDATIEKVKATLKEQGFNVVSEINMQEKLKKGANKDIPRYMILGACNPEGAFQAVQLEPNIGVMLPCNVIVRETGKGEIVIAAVNPMVTMKSAGNDDLKPLAEEISARLTKVINSFNK
jgi:uncharacterized protein (DUF302 family)